jgi:hypothetical protein
MVHNLIAIKGEAASTLNFICDAHVRFKWNAGSGKTLSVPAFTVNDGNSGNNYTVALVPNTTGVINKATPVLSGLSAPSVQEDTASTSVGGTIAYLPVGTSPVYPTGSVSITFQGVTKSAPIAANGTFSVAFATSGLEDGSYAIKYSFTSSDGNFNSAATVTTTLTIHD